MKSKCSDFEQLIALYVEEDLSGSERGRVEAHLRECSSCWDLAEDLKESQAVFKSIRQDIPDATALSSLRERVLSEVSGLEPRTWFERLIFGGRRKAALASIAVVLIGASVLRMTRPTGAAGVVRNPDAHRQSPPLAVLATPPQEEVTKSVPAPAPAVVTEEPKQVAIKFVTDDPDVIIYWLVDEKGD